MRWLLTRLREFRFKRWFDKNASDVLTEGGIDTEFVVLDFGCGSGTYISPVAKLVGEAGRVFEGCILLFKKEHDHIYSRHHKGSGV